MTLPEALQELAPVADDLPPDVNARREEAGRVVFDHLRRLARAIFRDPAAADDAVQSILVRLLQAGPRGPRDSLVSEEQAVGYLRSALRNGRTDRHRRDGRFLAVDPQDHLGEVRLERATAGIGQRPPDVLLALIDDERQHLLTRATTLLYEELLPALASQQRDAAGFMRTVRDVRDLARGRVSIDAILGRDGLTPGRTAINRLYQQHKRARAAFLERLRARLRDQPLPSDLDDVVRRLAEFDMASRVVRGGQPS